MTKRLALKASFVVVCFALVLFPMSIGAQTPGDLLHGTKKGVEKGAGEVQKGAEGAAHETKKGAEAVGKGVKKGVTGEDENTNIDRSKGTQTYSESGQPTGVHHEHTGKKHLPKTAGELPLLALLGALSLIGAAVSRTTRRVRSNNS